MNWHSIYFLLFSLFACGFALAVVFTSNIVRMAFYLVLSLGATAGLFFLAGSDFIGAMQLLIYVGGTLVLLVFGVMLTAQSPFISMKTRGGDWILAAFVGGSLLALLVQAAFSVPEWQAGPADDDAAVAASRRRPPLAKRLLGVRVDALAKLDAAQRNTGTGRLFAAVRNCVGAFAGGVDWRRVSGPGKAASPSREVEVCRRVKRRYRRMT